MRKSEHLRGVAGVAGGGLDVPGDPLGYRPDAHVAAAPLDSPHDWVSQHTKVVPASPKHCRKDFSFRITKTRAQLKDRKLNWVQACSKDEQQ